MCGKGTDAAWTIQGRPTHTRRGEAMCLCGGTRANALSRARTVWLPHRFSASVFRSCAMSACGSVAFSVGAMAAKGQPL
jgi:hypothetical protein